MLAIDPIADVEGAITGSLSASSVVEGAVNMVSGAVTVIQSTLSTAQGFFMISQAAAAAAFIIPIIALEFMGLVDILLGLFMVFVGSIKSLIFFVPDLIDGIYTFAAFSLTWMLCFFKNLGNMQTCLFYYLLEVVGQILYLPVRLFLWILFQLGLDMYGRETQFWDVIELIDKFVMNYAGFHISHYPKNIREKCYNCQRLKVSALVEHTTPLANDVSVRIPKLLMPGFNLIGQGGNQLMHPFDVKAPNIDPDVFTSGWDF